MSTLANSTGYTVNQEAVTGLRAAEEADAIQEYAAAGYRLASRVHDKMQFEQVQNPEPMSMAEVKRRLMERPNQCSDPVCQTARTVREPEMQQLPSGLRRAIRTRSKSLRKLLATLDFADLEKRMLAYNGADLHRQRAALVFGIPAEQVTPGQRKLGKVLNFADSYSVDSDALKRILEQNIRPPRGAKRCKDMK